MVRHATINSNAGWLSHDREDPIKPKDNKTGKSAQCMAQSKDVVKPQKSRLLIKCFKLNAIVLQI